VLTERNNSANGTLALKNQKPPVSKLYSQAFILKSEKTLKELRELQKPTM
jgi:hypothetical protein